MICGVVLSEDDAWLPFKQKTGLRRFSLYNCSGFTIFSSSLHPDLNLSLYFLLQSLLPWLCDPPGATPVRRIFERRNSPAVCQKVSTGPWNNCGISVFHRAIVRNTARVMKPNPRMPKPAYFKILNVFILVIC